MPKLTYNSPFKIPFLGLILSIAVQVSAFGQDLHFSQFYLNPQHLNPGLTGVYAGEWRAGGAYKSQWQSVPVQYRTGAAWFDYKALSRVNTIVAVGLLAQYDQAGDAQLGWSQIGFNSSVVQNIAKNQAVSLGFGLAFVQRSIDLSNLTFKNQWDGDLYNPSLPSKEAAPGSSGFKPSLSTGINWHYEPGGASRTQIDAGIGAFHLNSPDLRFLSDQDGGFRLDPRLTMYANSVIHLRGTSDLVLFGMRQSMNVANEIILGGGVRYWLSNSPGNYSAIRFTLANRLKDAIIPAIQVERNAWTVGISYDWNISPFQVATNRRGGIEMAVIYRSQPAPPLKVAKVCPIF